MCMEYVVVAFQDSNYVADIDKGSHWLVMHVCSRVYFVSCKATLQLFVALPAIKVKHMSLMETEKKVIQLIGLVSDLLDVWQDPVFIYYDSMSAICLAMDQVFHN